jgi:hypothetical protein
MRPGSFLTRRGCAGRARPFGIRSADIFLRVAVATK